MTETLYDGVVVPFPFARVWVCATCGNHYPGSAGPPPVCGICADERRWLPPSGQRWTTVSELSAAGFRCEVRDLETGLTGVGVEPVLGAGHRGLLLQTDEGNVLWDPPGLLDDDAVDEIRARGGVDVLSASHPHFHGALLECRDVFGAEIVLPEAHLPLPTLDDDVRAWSGTEELLPGVTLVECDGRLACGAVLHWADGADGGGVLLTGDTVLVTPDEDRVAFAWSAPNHIPMPERGVSGIVRAVRPFRFERIYGGWWNPVVRRDGHRILETSAKRYIQFLRGDVPL